MKTKLTHKEKLFIEMFEAIKELYLYEITVHPIMFFNDQETKLSERLRKLSVPTPKLK